MPEHRELSQRSRGKAIVGLGIGALALGFALCNPEGKVPVVTDDSSPEEPSLPPEVDGPRQVTGGRVEEVMYDDDSVEASGPSVEINPEVFEMGVWDLSVVSRCVRTPEDVTVSYPMGPNEMTVISLLDGPHFPVRVREDRDAMLLRVGNLIVRYDWEPESPREVVEGRLTELCRDARWAVHRTDWPSERLCGEIEDPDECDAYIGEQQYEGSEKRLPSEMIYDLLDVFEEEGLFEEGGDRYKLNAFRVDSEFSGGLGHLSVLVNAQEIEGEWVFSYDVSSTRIGGFHQFTTPEEVVNFIRTMQAEVRD